jgi:hypothetical protein
VFLSDFKLAYKLRNIPCDFSSDFFVYAMLKGTENLDLYKSIIRPAKFVMAVHHLKILGHEIAISPWKQESKTFFGSFCMAEILPCDNSGKKFETVT